MRNKKGIIHLLPLIVIAIVLVGGFFLFGKKIQQKITSTREPSVNLRSQYQNPFDKKAQYVNPFSQFKNPFDAAK